MLDGVVLQTANDDENEVSPSQISARSKQRPISSGTRTVLHRASSLLVRERGMLKKGATYGCGTVIHSAQVLPTKICETFFVTTANNHSINKLCRF